jgi:hypothetical protein
MATTRMGLILRSGVSIKSPNSMKDTNIRQTAKEQNQTPASQQTCKPDLYSSTRFPSFDKFSDRSAALLLITWDYAGSVSSLSPDFAKQVLVNEICRKESTESRSA